MKKALALSAILALLCAGVVCGQPGHIGLYADEGYSTWCYEDFGPTLVRFYVVHILMPGATGSRWMADPGGNWNCVYFGETIHIPAATGSALSGITLDYGGCLAPNVLLARIDYLCQGESPSCSYLEIVGDPASGSGTVEVVDCTLTTLYGSGGKVYMNPDLSCPWCANPTSKTSWGQVKALYQ